MENNDYFLIVTQEDGIRSYSRLITHENFGLNLELNGDRAAVLKRLVTAIEAGEVIGSEVYKADKVIKVGVKRLHLDRLANPLHNGEINDDIQLKLKNGVVMYTSTSEAYYAEDTAYGN
ncbi:hypothetical protein FT641_18745 [Bacillus paranthracis]|uniref:hypothetical protein n=1 Tax=Bacillus paranthracis TaxID=2026186 RepID=UPI001879B858|nr:hypothetical protein [Bacillus paranthracis]MBE7114397.1 hypothetical protein [Bacillus paranthracis]MBE7154730.1 hypothetical protein [Bacillus paranthracis]